MVSKQKDEDLKTLLSMEIKLRILDTEGVDISQVDLVSYHGDIHKH